MWSQYFVFCYDSFFIWSTHKMLTIKRCIVWHFLLFILWNKSGFSSWLLCSKAQFHALLTTSLASIQRCPVRSSRFRFKRDCDWGGDLFTFCSLFFFVLQHLSSCSLTTALQNWVILMAEGILFDVRQISTLKTGAMHHTTCFFWKKKWLCSHKGKKNLRVSNHRFPCWVRCVKITHLFQMCRKCTECKYT